MTKDERSGLVVRLQSGFYTVQSEQGTLVCKIRGRLKKGPKREAIVAVGDNVMFTTLSDGSGIIESVLPRHHVLERLAPTPRGDYNQILLANPDQVVLVFACAEPEPHLRMLDRFLVICEKQDIAPLIVANKIDLVGLEKARELFLVYESLDYTVIYTSVPKGYGVDEFREALQGQLSALAGPSGVGKTSLLNAVQPDLDLSVRDVSEATSKGRHTTVVRQIFKLDGGGYVADMPGLRSLALWDTEPEELDGYFPELRPLVAHCRFNDCTHLNEPGCAVREAVADGRVYPERYQSYLRLRFEEE